MDIKKILKDFFSLGAIYYTVLSVVIIVVGILMSEGSASKLLVPKQFLFLLLFCYIMALGSALKKLTVLPTVVAHLSHAACYVFGFMLFLALCGLEFVPVIIATALFAIFYVALTLSSSAFKKRSASTVARPEPRAKTTAKKEKSKRSAEYTSQFSFDSQSTRK